MDAPISLVEAQNRLAQPEDELLRSIGQDLMGRQALPLPSEELVERGKRWLNAQLTLLQAEVCSSEKIKSFVLKGDDDAAIVVEVASVLVGLFLPVNPVTLAVLVVKRGLKSLCSSRWEPSNGQDKS